MAESIVNVLEVIEIEEHQRHWLLIPLRQTDDIFGVIVQLDTVWQPCERIEMRQVLNSFLGFLARGNVSGNPKQHRDFAICITERSGMGFKPVLRSFDPFYFELKNTTFSTHHALLRGDKRIVIFGKNKVYEIMLLHLFYRICFEHSKTRSVHFLD